MAIEFRCPGCQKLLRTTDERAGMQAVCPSCGASLLVPRPGQAAGDEFADEFDFEDHSETDSFPQATAGSERRCPMCGAENPASAAACRDCGEPFGPRRDPTSIFLPTSALAVLSLIFGITSLVSLVTICFTCFSIPTGILAVVFGLGARAEIRRGSVSGAGMATTGILCGAGGLLGFVGYVLVLVFLA